LRRLFSSRGVDIDGGPEVVWPVLVELIREAEAGGMPMPGLDERAERARGAA
jgi:hypothetical protein